MADAVGTVKNPALFDALTSVFGKVRVTSAGENARWSWDLTKTPRVPKIDYGGEQYYVCCPVCGDTRYRLEIGHRLLTPLDRNIAPEILRYLYKCHNEGCKFHTHPYYAAIEDYLKKNPDLVGFSVARIMSSQASKQNGPEVPVTQDLPSGVLFLRDLPSGHPAREFVVKKYGFDPDAISDYFKVGYCATPDPKYPAAYNRIIFPIQQDGKWVSWQGRSLDPQATQRWYFPTGFRKVLYNWDNLPRQRGDVVVITEGIPASIASGPTATAIFGKELDPRRISLIVRDFKTAVIALDPETMIPDPTTRRKKGVKYDPADNGRIFAQELKERLDRAGLRIPAMLLKYPPEVMAAANAAMKQRRDEQDGMIPKMEKSQRLKVPDPADLGWAVMRGLLQALPASHRSAHLG